MDAVPTPMELATTHIYAKRDAISDYPATAICRKGSNGNAWLDCGFAADVSDPDFATYGYGPTFEEAAGNCARAVRHNASGLEVDRNGKPRRPKGCLTGYDLHYRLMPHWERKLLMARLGDDPNDAILALHAGDTWSLWPLHGEWLERVSGCRHLEFFFQVCLSIGRATCTTPAQAEAFGVEVADAALVEIKERMGRRLGATPLTHPTVRVRATRALVAHLHAQERTHAHA